MTDASRLADVLQKAHDAITEANAFGSIGCQRVLSGEATAKDAADFSYTVALRAALVALAEDAERFDWLEANKRDLIAPMAVPEFVSPDNPQGMTKWFVSAVVAEDGSIDEDSIIETATAREAVDAARAAHTATPERCPTCGSDDRAERWTIRVFGLPICDDDAWHGAATPPAEEGRC